MKVKHWYWSHRDYGRDRKWSLCQNVGCTFSGSQDDVVTCLSCIEEELSIKAETARYGRDIWNDYWWSVHE